MDVSVLWLKVTFERESVDLWICGGLVVFESKDSLMVQDELHTSQCQAREKSTLPWMGLKEQLEI